MYVWVCAFVCVYGKSTRAARAASMTDCGAFATVCFVRMVMFCVLVYIHVCMGVAYVVAASMADCGAFATVSFVIMVVRHGFVCVRVCMGVAYGWRMRLG